MSFGRAFDAFVGGLESGLKSGNDLQDRQLARRPAKEKADLDRSVPGPGMARVQGIESMKARVQSNAGDEAIPTQSSDDLGGFYAEGGEVTNQTGQTDTSKWGTFTPFQPQQAAPQQSQWRWRDQPGAFGQFARNIDAHKDELNHMLTPWDMFMGGRLKPALRQMGQAMHFADGGYVDPVEDDNGAYYRREAQRTQEAIPTAPVKAADGTPTPPARPGAPDQDLPTDAGGNIIQKTVKWVEGLPPTQNAPAIGGTGEQPSGPVHPIQEMVDISGRSYPDLTTTIGGIRAVTGAPANRPLTTADHVDFLQRRFQYAAQHGYDLNEALKFNVQYLDNLRFQAGRTFALAGAAWDAGDGQAVQKFVQQGYGLLPDGLSAKTSFKDGVLHVQAIDEKTGKSVGSPMTMDKDTFMTKAQSITGDPISWGRALENVPYTAGTTRAAGRGGRRASVEGGTTSEKPLPTSVFKGRDLGVATRIRDAIDDPKAGRTAGHIKDYIARAKGKPRDGEQGFGIYDANDQLVVKLNPEKLGVKPPNKVAEDPPAAPTQPAAAAKPAGIGATKTGPGTKPETPAQAPGTASAKPATSAPAIPEEPEGPGFFTKLGKVGNELGNKVVKPALGIPPREEQGSTTEGGTSDGQAAQKARVADLEKKLADAEKNGVPDATLKIMRARLEQERARLN